MSFNTARRGIICNTEFQECDKRLAGPSLFFIVDFTLMSMFHFLHNRRALAAFLLGILLIPVTAWAQDNGERDYSAGFSAFLNDDFVTARQHWLNAAKANHARAMFNLGLLHEQGKVPDASSEKADQWFSRAGRYGYVAADYHLGLRWLAQGGRDEEAQRRIQKAADAGYLPALRRVSKTTQPIPADKSLVSYLGESWIKSKPGAHWTIQLLAYRDRSKVERFIDEHDLNGKAAYFSERSADGVWFKLVYGSYDSKDKAEFARQNLPPVLTEFGPWLRRLSSVQSVIDAQ